MTGQTKQVVRDSTKTRFFLIIDRIIRQFFVQSIYKNIIFLSHICNSYVSSQVRTTLSYTIFSNIFYLGNQMHPIVL
jgi:hypothetical protein